MEAKKWTGPGGFVFRPEDGALRFGSSRLDAGEIRAIDRFSVFAGNKKGKKHTALLVIKWHDKIPCHLDVIAVKKTGGWLFFYDSEENFQRLRESLSKDEVSNEIFSELTAAKGNKNGKGSFLAHAALLNSYKTKRSRQKYVGDKWVDHEDMVPTLEPVYETEYYYDAFTLPGDWQEGATKCVCGEYVSFKELQSVLKQLKMIGDEKKRAEAQARQEREEAERLERERQEQLQQQQKQEEADRLWAEKKRKKTEQLRQERLKRTPEQLQEERRKRDMGKKGEKEVDYVIQWLAAEGYQSVPRRHCVKYDDETIFLWNPDFIDEPQEFDHIVLGRQGLFLIETKNYTGTLVVNQSGNWIRIKDGEEKGERSPVQQVRRHEKLLRSFLPDIPVLPIICIAHPEVVIKGAQNCAVPLVKSDMLGEHIEHYKSQCLSKAQIHRCLERIERYRLD